MYKENASMFYKKFIIKKLGFRYNCTCGIYDMKVSKIRA